MAFRLQSAIAGFAKRTSEKMEKFDDTYFETLKNTSANLANEAGSIRKDRTKAVREYGDKASVLQSDYGLTDGQVQELLKGGLSRYDQFVEAMNNAEAKPATTLAPGEAGPAPAFDRVKAAQAMFNMESIDENAILTVAEQGKSYAAKMFPSTFDLEATSQAVSTGTQRGIFKIDAADIAPKLRGAIGDLEDEDIREIGSTGIMIEGLGRMQASDIIALKDQIASLESKIVGTEETRARIRLVDQNILSSESATKIAEASEARAAELFPVVKNNEQLKAREIATGITSNRLSADKLREEIAILQETGLDAAELALELTRQQIITSERQGAFDSVEKLFAGTVSLRDDAAAKVAELEADPTKAGSTELAQAQAVLSMYEDAVLKNTELYGNNISDDILSKVNLDSAFEKAIKQNAGGLDIGAIYGSFEAGLDVALGDEGQLPEYFQAVDSAITEMRERFGTTELGGNFVEAKKASFAKQINSYANKNPSMIYTSVGGQGSMPTKMDQNTSIYTFPNTKQELDILVSRLEALPNLKKGMLIYVNSNSSGTEKGRYLVYGPSKEWL